MDLDPTYILVGLVVGMVGMGLMMFGKKMGDLRALAVGAVLSGETLFIQQAGTLLVASAATLVGYYLWRKYMPA